MEIEEKRNSDYHERFKPKYWSELPLDLLIPVLERLSFANFQRAKSVCSSWYSASRQSSMPKNQIPWLILFPKHNNNNDNHNSCMLFNPEEEDKLYKTKDLGVEFVKSICTATYGSWLLMRGPLFHIYIVNLFTHEMINLPSVELLMKDYELNIASHMGMRYRGILRSPVFWIDEKSKDYVVVWGFKDWCVVYAKKGDTSWNQIPETSDCYEMVYKDHTLYFLSYTHGSFKIFDFSGETPRQTLHSYVRVELFESARAIRRASNSWRIAATKLVVTLTGEVLKVEKWWRPWSKTLSFRIFKIYSSGGIIKEPEQIYSLGEESMLLDQGITLQANDIDGFIRNSIYFIVDYGKITNDIVIFNLETQEMEPQQLHTLLDSSSVQFSRSRWFLPSFTHT